jgi:hypothetical protein
VSVGFRNDCSCVSMLSVRLRATEDDGVSLISRIVGHA